MKVRYNNAEPLLVGGQAVLEGVMMRAPGMVATAVRRSNGEIVVQNRPYHSLGERFSLCKLPVLRGAAGLVEMMIVGIRTLNYSAEVALEDERGNSAVPSKPETHPDRRRRERVSLALTVILSLAAGVGVFFLTPIVVTSTFFDVDQQPVLFNVLAGMLRIGLMLCYLAGISLMKDIRRLFQYHGAEHKAVFAFERGLGLTVDAAAMQSRFHPRCGTSFLLIVMIVSILLFSLLDALLLHWLGEITLVTRLLTHLPLIPVVGGVSYECIRMSAQRSESAVGRMLVAPGLWLQRITTREPDAAQLEVAITALMAALGEERMMDQEKHSAMAS